jgi:hypothetical protein
LSLDTDSRPYQTPVSHSVTPACVLRVLPDSRALSHAVECHREVQGINNEGLILEEACDCMQKVDYGDECSELESKLVTGIKLKLSSGDGD